MLQNSRFFFSKSVKKSVTRGVRVLRVWGGRKTTCLSPVSLSVLSLVPDLSFDCSRVLEYAKIRTVLQSRLLLHRGIKITFSAFELLKWNNVVAGMMMMMMMMMINDSGGDGGCDDDNDDWVTDVSTTSAVVIFWFKVSCITSVDGIILWLLTWLVNEVAMLLVVCQLSRSCYKDSKCHWCVSIHLLSQFSNRFL